MTEDRRKGHELEAGMKWRRYCVPWAPHPITATIWAQPGMGTHCPVTGVSKGRSHDRQWKCAKSCL